MSSAFQKPFLARRLPHHGQEGEGDSFVVCLEPQGEEEGEADRHSRCCPLQGYARVLHPPGIILRHPSGREHCRPTNLECTCWQRLEMAFPTLRLASFVQECKEMMESLPFVAQDALDDFAYKKATARIGNRRISEGRTLFEHGGAPGRVSWYQLQQGADGSF